MSASYFPPIISSIYLEELAGQATDAKDSALVALNAAEAARDTALEYRNDAQTYYTQVQQIQEGDYVTNLSLEERLGAFNFADLQGIPATFAPSAHGHSWSEIANKPTMYPPTAHGHAWSEITGKPSEFEPAPHIHTWQQIAQKPGTFPPETHFHSWNEIENKPNVFNPAAHTHSWGDISGKPTKFEPAAHTHSWDLIENKPLTFPPQSHHHHWSQVTSKPEQATRWPHFSEVTNKPVQATRWPKYSEVTDKPVLGSAAAKNVGVNIGDVQEFGQFGMGLRNGTELKNSAGEKINDLNQGDQPSQIFVFDSATVNRPKTPSGGVVPNGVGITLSRTLDIWSQITIDRVTNDYGQMITRTKNGVDVIERLMYDSKNTNLNEFGASGQDVVAFGEMVTATIARFYMPINSFVVPTSIAVAGTFRILQGGATIATGVTPTFTSLSSFKVLVVEVTGVSGNAGSPVNLRADSSSSKITANF